VTRCAVPWGSFGLEPPPFGCERPAVVEVTQGCAHEHVCSGLACAGCLGLMESYQPLQEWGCGPCVSGSVPHQCRAPVLVRVLGGGVTCPSPIG